MIDRYYVKTPEGGTVEVGIVILSHLLDHDNAEFLFTTDEGNKVNHYYRMVNNANPMFP